ncbi:MAG: PIG-L family deacetylase [Chitinophagales bacterium]|nr:PIG-L family deacetylase [Chitinophagales bacterium]
MKIRFAFVLFICLYGGLGFAQSPKVLIVIAHPDDETSMAATVYKITHEQQGVVDLCLITNGEGGYKYSTLAEDYYHLELTDENVGREYLPRIRKEELMNAGKIIGIRNYFFLDQKDTKYGLNELDPLDTAWNIALVKQRIADEINRNRYDYVFAVIPDPATHAHHKAATILALQTVQSLPDSIKPVILGVSLGEMGDTIQHEYVQLKDYSETRIDTSINPFYTNRTVKFGFKEKLDYKIIVNWEIAEHKSQGTMQLAMNQGDLELFYYFSINSPTKMEKTKAFFQMLNAYKPPIKTY